MSKFSLYQFYSETWQGAKRISGVFYGDGHHVRYLEIDSQVTDQLVSAKVKKPTLEPHQIFLPWVESASFFLIPQDRLEAGIVYLERGGDTSVKGTACDLIIMQRDLSNEEEPLPLHQFRIALRKSDGLPIAYQMNWNMGDEESMFLYEGKFQIVNFETSPVLNALNESLLPKWVQRKLKKRTRNPKK